MHRIDTPPMAPPGSCPDWRKELQDQDTSYNEPMEDGALAAADLPADAGVHGREDHRLGDPYDDDPPLRVCSIESVYGKDDEAQFQVKALDVINKASGRHISFHVVTTKKDHPGVVCVITTRLPDGSTGILLGQHWRPSTGAWAWELPRGMGELGEDLESTAIRESLEETGIAVDPSNVEVLQLLQADTGVLSNTIGVVLLRAPEDVTAVQMHDWELSRMDWWTMDEIRRAVVEGKITCGITLAALMAYESRFSHDGQ